MFGIRFPRSVGSAADVKELEYIIALCQSSKETRQNATVSSIDIKWLLKSRYLLEISHEEAIEVVRSLGGGHSVVDHDGSDDGENPLLRESSQKYSETTIRDSQEEENWPKRWLHQVPNLFHHDSSSSQRSKKNQDSKVMKGSARSVETATRVLQDLQRLAKLNAANRKGLADGTKVSTLQDKIRKDLADKVKQKSNSPPGEDNDTIEVGLEPSITQSTSCETDDANETEKLLDERGEEVETKAGRFSSENEPKGEPPAEFLDLVQILSTLLIPTLSRIACEAQEGKNPPPPDASRRGESKANFLWNRPGGLFRRGLDESEVEQQPSLSSQEIIQLGKEALLKVVPRSIENPAIDEAFVQLLLVSHGEMERAGDPILVKEMVAVAKSSSGWFDEAALANAISADLKAWDPQAEEEPTTFFYDVFHELTPTKDSKLRPSAIADVRLTGTERISDGNNTAKRNGFFMPEDKQIDTNGPAFDVHLGGLDFVLDSQSSVLITLASAFFFVLSLAVYGGLLVPDVPDVDCGDHNFLCTIVNTIIAWASIALFCLWLGLSSLSP